MRDDRGERKKYKIINRRATVTVHIHSYCSICHKCTFLPLLMWVFFGQKCVKILPFSILQKFTRSYVIALTSIAQLWLYL